jgi:aromatic ring-opening dioxygenase catalytic subunit (LigB family)
MDTDAEIFQVSIYIVLENEKRVNIGNLLNCSTPKHELVMLIVSGSTSTAS